MHAELDSYNSAYQSSAVSVEKPVLPSASFCCSENAENPD